MDLKSLSKEQLLKRTSDLITEERKITAEVLWHLLEIERRRLFAERGFSSLFEFCVKELGYSESAACRRISAMRLLREIPEVETKIRTGELSLSNASQVQNTLRAIRRHKGKFLSADEKKRLIESVERKSSRECQKILCEVAPQAVLPERTKALTRTQTEIRFVADDELMQMLSRIKDLKGFSDYASLMKWMAKMALIKLEKTTGLDKPEKTTQAPPASVVQSDSADRKEAAPSRNAAAASRHSRYLPGRCESRFALQIDHCKPFALDGTNAPDNLRLVCRTHNQLYALQTYGREKIRSFIQN